MCLDNSKFLLLKIGVLLDFIFFRRRVYEVFFRSLLFRFDFFFFTVRIFVFGLCFLMSNIVYKVFSVFSFLSDIERRFWY